MASYKQMKSYAANPVLYKPFTEDQALICNYNSGIQKCGKDLHEPYTRIEDKEFNITNTSISFYSITSGLVNKGKVAVELIWGN